MRQSGFTLLELSIVLVIIGLIIGGVTVGSELIRQAGLQSIGKDFQKYETAVQTFRLKYEQLPGDMPNAYAYWPALKDKYNTAYTNANVCQSSSGLNGDGDGLIEETQWVKPGEDIRAWTHMAAAGLIDGAYNSGYGGGFGYNVIWGLHMPKSKLGDSGYDLASSSVNVSAGCGNDTSGNQSGGAQNGKTGNYIMLAALGSVNGITSDSGMASGGALTTQEAQSIDRKLDDGFFASGKLMGRNPYDDNGADPVRFCDNSTGKYDLSYTSPNACRLVYWLN